MSETRRPFILTATVLNVAALVSCPPPPPPHTHTNIHPHTALREWLRLYKSPTGVINEFAFSGEAKPATYVKSVLRETHDLWKALMARPTA
jgi:hypothetical protein